jgi:hypothetical protein
MSIQKELDPLSALRGKIVRVLPAEEVNGRFVGKQGYVSEITPDEDPNGPIGVQFPRKYKYLFDYPNSPETIVRFQPEELQIESCWEPLTVPEEAEALFGNMHSQVCWTNRPFWPGIEVCQHQECSNRALLLILVNNWGTVSQFRVCSEHAVWHGRNCDGFPAKQA